MKKTGFILVMLALLLVFGLAFVGCDMGSQTKFEGRWYIGTSVLRYTFSGNNFTYAHPDRTVTGTFTFDDFNIRFTASNDATWRTTYTLSGNTLTLDAGGTTSGSISPAAWFYGTYTRR